MKTSKVSPMLKWITGGLEALLGIPFLGGLIVVSLLWIPLIVMAVLHVITLIVARKEEENIHGSIVGIITSVLAWIPILGMILHITSAIVLLMDVAKAKGSHDAHDDSSSFNSDHHHSLDHDDHHDSHDSHGFSSGDSGGDSGGGGD
ncbi:MAG TPA: hypothetical protein VEY51_13640 [Chondromyces sp.]|nr:hypothetical protein [Chondromyces sp.]